MARRTGGVVHTPVALARAMVRQADALLADAGLPLVGSAALEVVDPATGPGIFLAAVLAHARGQGSRLLGVDLDGAASRASRRALVQFARARGWSLELEVRDALATPHAAAQGSSRALLVIGNPPWSARGLGPDYVEGLVRDLHLDEHGRPLAERRRGVLADAYVRFLRWALDAIERAPAGGALVLVTNASYLDGPVHRGLRALLASRLERVRVLDLGGSALVARAPGTVDANLFGVRPGAAILLASRGAEPRGRGVVSYRGVTGTVADKLAALAAPELAWAPVPEPLASLRPRPREDAAYASWPSLAQWLPFHAEGIQTNRDEHVVERDRAALLGRLRAMARGEGLPPARPHFDPRAAARVLARLEADGALEAHLARLAYRPFDTRFAFLHASLCHRPRPPLLAAAARSPLTLVSARKDRGALPWAHVALVDAPIDNCYLSARSSCRARAFPSHRGDGSPNVAPAILATLRERGLEPSAEDVVAYLAAVLSSPRYATRFASALALDYPRAPLPADEASFARLVALGRRLAAILGAEVPPISARAGRAVVRVGHHAFDPGVPVVAALVQLRREIDDLVALP